MCNTWEAPSHLAPEHLPLTEPSASVSASATAGSCRSPLLAICPTASSPPAAPRGHTRARRVGHHHHRDCNLPVEEIDLADALRHIGVEEEDSLTAPVAARPLVAGVGPAKSTAPASRHRSTVRARDRRETREGSLRRSCGRGRAAPCALPAVRSRRPGPQHHHRCGLAGRCGSSSRGLVRGRVRSWSFACGHCQSWLFSIDAAPEAPGAWSRAPSCVGNSSTYPSANPNSRSISSRGTVSPGMPPGSG